MEPLAHGVDLKQEIGKQVPVRPKAKLREAANSHMMRREQTPEHVIGHFQDKRVRYVAKSFIGQEQ